MLCDIIIALLRRQPTVQRVDSPVFIVGDIHGSFHDLIRIFKNVGDPPKSKYIFLGDYVDRGNFSLECVVLLFYLLASHPDDVFLIRGNHECRKVNSLYGFRDEIIGLYGNSDKLYEKINDVFDFLPLAIIIDGTTLCLHGGIAPDFDTIQQLEAIERPISDPEGWVESILWSDPSKTFHQFSESERGKGYTFGMLALNAFLEQNKLIRIVRGHQCVMHGVQMALNSKCVTVFSSSNYHENLKNECGIIRCLADKTLKNLSFSPLRKMAREEAQFFSSKYKNYFQPPLSNANSNNNNSSNNNNKNSNENKKNQIYDVNTGEFNCSFNSPSPSSVNMLSDDNGWPPKPSPIPNFKNSTIPNSNNNNNNNNNNINGSENGFSNSFSYAPFSPTPKPNGEQQYQQHLAGRVTDTQLGRLHSLVQKNVVQKAGSMTVNKRKIKPNAQQGMKMNNMLPKLITPCSKFE